MGTEEKSGPDHSNLLDTGEELYRDLIEHSVDLIGIHDMDGVILSINPAAARQLGYCTTQELIGRNFNEFIAPDTKKLFARYLESLKKGASSGLMKVLTRTGEERIWEFHNSVRTEGVERPVVRALAHDITEQRRTEAALREGEKLNTALYRIAESASSSADLQDLYAEIYSCISDLINVPNFYIAFFDRQTNTVTFPYHVDNYDPDWEPKIGRKGLTEYVIRTGKPALVTPEIFAQLLESGEVEVVISRRIDWMGVPLQSKGETFGMLGAHSYSGDVRFGPRDLEILTFVSRQVASAIERKQAQEDLIRAEERFRQVVEFAPNAMLMADESGRIALVNGMAERLFGYTREELLKMRIEDLIPTRYRVDHEKERAAFAERDQPRPMGAHRGLVALRKDGAEVPVEIGLNPVRSRQGRFVLAAVVDITERKKAEQLKDEMSSVVAHELKAPLSSILGSLSYLHSKGYLQERDLKLVDMAERNSQRMLRLVNDLLEIDKIESGKVVLDLKQQALMPLVEQAIEINQAYAMQYETRIAILETLPGATVNVDSDRFQQVMTNLLTNAAKFSPEGGEVEVRAAQVGNRARVAVRDHGPGVPKAFRNSIFQRFAQAATDRAKKGSGLGLNISKALVERMGGTIGFESAPGTGAVFYFELPLV